MKVVSGQYQSKYGSSPVIEHYAILPVLEECEYCGEFFVNTLTLRQTVARNWAVIGNSNFDVYPPEHYPHPYHKKS